MKPDSPSSSPTSSPRSSAVRRRRRRIVVATLATLLVAIPVVARWRPLRDGRWLFPSAVSVGETRPNPPRSKMAAQIVTGARAQIGTRYDAAYLPIRYPNGDVPADRGACTDVVIRALRAAGVDLQLQIHHDMAARFAAYPKTWGLSAPNPNIDHRRVPNQIEFLRRHAHELTRDVDQSTLMQWQPGDIVYWRSGPQRLHTGVLSDRADGNGVPLVIHNGSICIEDNCLTRWPIIGHFRLSTPNSMNHKGAETRRNSKTAIKVL